MILARNGLLQVLDDHLGPQGLKLLLRCGRKHRSQSPIDQLKALRKVCAIALPSGQLELNIFGERPRESFVGQFLVNEPRGIFAVSLLFLQIFRSTDLADDIAFSFGMVPFDVGIDALGQGRLFLVEEALCQLGEQHVAVNSRIVDVQVPEELLGGFLILLDGEKGFPGKPKELRSYSVCQWVQLQAFLDGFQDLGMPVDLSERLAQGIIRFDHVALFQGIAQGRAECLDSFERRLPLFVCSSQV